MTDQGVSEYQHEPVLVEEVVNWLSLPRGGVFIDFTVGGGSHLARIAEASASGSRLYGVDRDVLAVETARARLAGFSQVEEIIHAPFASAVDSLAERQIEQIHGALFDLGVSSPQIDRAERGFAFQQSGPLDMRMDRDMTPTTAADILNSSSQAELTRIISDYGEERRASRIARAIVSERENSPITESTQFKNLLERTLGPANLTKTLARVYQALRIAVNDELGQLQFALERVIDLLAPHGRVGVISYHSLEDRITKNIFKSRIGECVCPPNLPVCACGARATLKILTRKPITPSEQEISANPRARSAKFRVAEKMQLNSGASA